MAGPSPPTMAPAAAVSLGGSKSEDVNGEDKMPEETENSASEAHTHTHTHTHTYTHTHLSTEAAIPNKSGFELGWQAEEILGATEEQKQILFLIRW